MAIGLGIAMANGSANANANADDTTGSPSSSSDSNSSGTGGEGAGASNDSGSVNKAAPDVSDDRSSDDAADTGSGDTDLSEPDDDADASDTDLTDSADDETGAEAEHGDEDDRSGRGTERSSRGGALHEVSGDDGVAAAAAVTAPVDVDVEAAPPITADIAATEPSPIIETLPEPVDAAVPTTETTEISDVPALDAGETPDPLNPIAPTVLAEFAYAAHRSTNQARTQAFSVIGGQTTSLMAFAELPAPLAAAAGDSTRIALGGGVPLLVITSPDGTRTYTVSMPMFGDANGLGDSQVIGIDTATNQKVGDPIAVGFILPSAFATSAKLAAFSRDSSRLYVASRGQTATGQNGATITVIDAVNGRVLGDPIEVATTLVTGLVISGDGRRLYTANVNNTVSVFDLQDDNALLATLLVSAVGGPAGHLDIAIAENDAQTVYISNFAERTAYAVEPATSSFIGDPVLLDDLPVSIALSPDGQRLFVNTYHFSDPSVSTQNEAKLVVVDVATRSVVNSIQYGPGSQGPATNGAILVSPEGRYVYTQSVTTSPGTDPTAGVWKIDTLVGTAAFVHGTGFGLAPALSPDGKRLYVATVTVTDGEPQWAIGAIDTSDFTMLTRIPIDIASSVSMSVRPDGSRLYVGQMLVADLEDPSSVSGELLVVDTGTSNVVTPPRPVNPITLLVRNVIRAVVATVETIAHVVRQTVASVTKLVTTIAAAVGNISFETSLAVVQALQAVTRIGGSAIGNLLTAVSAITTVARDGIVTIPFIVSGLVGDLISAARNRSPVGFLLGQAISIWSFVGEQLTQVDFKNFPNTLRYALQHPDVALSELTRATLTVGLRVGTSMATSIAGVGKAALGFVDDGIRIAGKGAKAVGDVVVNTAKTVVNTAKSVYKTTTTAVAKTVDVLGKAASNIRGAVGKGANKVWNAVTSFRLW